MEQRNWKKRRHNIYETIIKNGLLYGSETWRITERNRRKLEAVEMDVLRRSARISRLDCVRNEEVKREIGIEGSIMEAVERKRLIWYGHVERMSDERLPKQVMKYMPRGYRRRGRPKKSWNEGIRKAMSARNLRDGEWEDKRRWKAVIGQRRKTL